MSETVTIGGQTFPLPATPAGKIADPIAVALLDFLAYYINDSLNPQIALLYPAPSSVPTAVPAGKRYPYDPKELWPQNGAPALYLWWKSSRSQPWSILKDRVQSTYELLYIGHERRDPLGTATIAGIARAVDRVIRLAADRGWHEDYGYNGAPDGEPVHVTVGFQGWEVVDSEPGAMRPVPGGRREAASGAQVNHFPAVRARINVWEIVEQGTPQDPADALGDSLVTISTNENGDVTDVVEFMQGYLPAPDGSEDGDK